MSLLRYKEALRFNRTIHNGRDYGGKGIVAIGGLFPGWIGSIATKRGLRAIGLVNIAHINNWHA